MHNPLLTIRDVAAEFGVSPMTIRRWWYAGRIPKPIKIQGSLRWRGGDVQQWLADVPLYQVRP